MSEPTLFDPGRPEQVLTDRQALAWEAIRRAGPDGLNADEVGAILHEHVLRQTGRRGHHRDTRCNYCGMDGRSVLRSRALKQLVKRRRGGGYVPRNPNDREATTSAQTEEIPF